MYVSGKSRRGLAAFGEFTAAPAAAPRPGNPARAVALIAAVAPRFEWEERQKSLNFGLADKCARRLYSL